MPYTSLLQILSLICALLPYSVYARFTCPCKCEEINKNGVRVKCIDNTEKEGILPGHTLTIYPKESVEISCHNSVSSWDHFLNGTILDDIDPINSITFRNCRPLNAENFRLVSKRLSFDHSIEQLTYDNLPRKLQSSDFDFLTNLKRLKVGSYFGDANRNDDVNFIRGLSNLIELSLRGSYIKLSVGFFYHLKKLQYIDLSFNEIDKLQPGVFNGLESICQIDLSRNNLSELHPTVFQNLTTLQKLILNVNPLKELLNDVFKGLPQLQELHIRNNNITTLPKDIFRYNIHLKILIMSDNNVDIKLLNSPLANLASLANLELIGNGLESVPEDMLWNSSSITKLDLSFNSLTELSEVLLKDAVNLKELHLLHNKLTNITGRFFLTTPELKILDLSENKFQSIDQFTFKYLEKLEILYMENNMLSSIHENAFFANKKLKIINLAKNHLTMSSDKFDSYGRLSVIKYNSNLEEINLAYNKISEIFSDWLRSPKLRKLDLRNNSITELQSESLLFIEKNVEINIQKNKLINVNLTGLKSIENNKISNGEHIVKVQLETNPFECSCDSYSLLYYDNGKIPKVYIQLEFTNNRCIGSEYISKIIFGNFYIDDFQCKPKKALRLPNDPCGPNSLCDCRLKPIKASLQVNCSARGITFSPEYIDTLGANTVTLDLSNNELVNYPDMTKVGFKKVTSLLLGNNKIETVDENLITSNLTYLELTNNRLTHLNKNFLDKIYNSSLRNLTLSCGLNDLCDCCINPIKALLQMNCSARGITSSPEYIDTLGANSVILDLSNNELVNHPDMTKVGYEKVTSLLLGNNKIETVDENLITSNLTHLELTNNRLTHLNKNFLDKIYNSSLRNLTLSCGPNDLCDCCINPIKALLQMNCSARGITSSPEYIDTLGANSVILDLSNNELVNHPDMTKVGYEKVTSLLLGNNKIETVDENLITSNLTNLVLTNNRLPRLNRTFLDKIYNSSLQNLTLSCGPNGLCECVLKPLKAFLEINCSARGITSPPEYIDRQGANSVIPDLSNNELINHSDMTKVGYEKVISFLLGNNKIETVDENSIASNLSYLELTNNRLLHLSKILLDMIYNSSRRNLNLSCGPNDLCDCWLNPIKALLQMNCSATGMTSAPEYIDTLHANSVILDLSNNELVNHPDMTKVGFEKVTSLLLGYNKIETVDENLITSNLTYLELTNNRLTHLNKTFLDKIYNSSLRNLTLSCGPNGLCDCWINPIKALLQMNCSARGITSSPEYIDTLGANSVILDLSNNELVNHPDMSKVGYKKVTSLLLGNNKIDTVDVSLITLNLTYLELTNNRLTHLNETFLGKIYSSSLRNLVLSNNPWRCGCDVETEQFRSFLQTHSSKIPDVSNVICTNHIDALVNLTRKDFCFYLRPMIIGVAIGCAIIFLFITIFVTAYFVNK